jgi:two-component system NarL family sensor kinase
MAILKLAIAERRLTVWVIDHGVGFDSQKVEASFGIRGMRERAGRAGVDFAIESSPGHGTSITIEIDLAVSGDGSQI